MSRYPEGAHKAILKYLREFHGIELSVKHFLGWGGDRNEEYFECTATNKRKMKLKKDEAKLYREKVSGLQMTDVVNLGDPDAIEKIVKHFKQG